MSELAALMATDPLELSDDDIGKIVTDMRQRREQFLAGEAQAGNMKKAAVAKPKSKDDIKNLLDSIKL